MDVTADPTLNSAFAPPPVPAVGTDLPADLSPHAADLRTKILAVIIELTERARLPQEWRFLGVSTSMRCLGSEPSDLVASLRTKFSLDELLATRIVVVGPDNQPQLSPIFGDTSSSFVILRDAMRSPSDVISARGLLSSPAPDWLRLAAEPADGSTRHEQPVLLAFSDAEALVWHRLGFHFASAAGLEQLSGQQVRALFAARPERREQRKFKLTLAGWQIAECVNQPSPSTLGALARLSRIQTVFGCDPADVFAAWLPTPAEFRAIRSARSFADRAVVWKTFSHSLHHSRFSPAGAASCDSRSCRDRLRHSPPQFSPRNRALPPGAAMRRGRCRTREVLEGVSGRHPR